MTFGKNIAIAAILTDLNALQASEIIVRRLAYLRSVGEDEHNTVAWRDAVAELAEFERAVSMRTWHLRTRIYA